MARKKRAPVSKPGELRVGWGAAERGDLEDVCYAWGGEGANKSDAHLLHNAIGSSRFSPSFERPGYTVEPSLIEELAERGYDLSTLRISIRKKAAEGA